MSIFEYDKEEEEKKLRKAEYEAGIQKGVLNTARHLLELNLLSLENISRATGLSIDELKSYSNNLVKEAHKTASFFFDTFYTNYCNRESTP